MKKEAIDSKERRKSRLGDLEVGKARETCKYNLKNKKNVKTILLENIKKNMKVSMNAYSRCEDLSVWIVGPQLMELFGKDDA